MPPSPLNSAFYLAAAIVTTTLVQSSDAAKVTEWTWTRRDRYDGSKSTQLHEVINGKGILKSKDTSNIINGIPARAGCSIKIKKLGICGDGDRYSGPCQWRFTGDGGGTWTCQAGQQGTRYRSSTYQLGYTSYRSGGYTNFVYKAVTKQYGMNKPVKVDFLGTSDNDGLRCGGTDEVGINYRQYDASASSSYRVWARFEYTCFEDCPGGQYRSNPAVENSCRTCTACASGSYGRAGTCTGTVNRQCSKCTSPPQGDFFASTACSSMSDAAYAPCSATCASSELELRTCKGGLSGFDRLCVPKAVFAPGTEAKAQALANRVAIAGLTSQQAQLKKQVETDVKSQIAQLSSTTNTALTDLKSELQTTLNTAVKDAKDTADAVTADLASTKFALKAALLAAASTKVVTPSATNSTGATVARLVQTGGTLNVVTERYLLVNGEPVLPFADVKASVDDIVEKAFTDAAERIH